MRQKMWEMLFEGCLEYPGSLKEEPAHDIKSALHWLGIRMGHSRNRCGHQQGRKTGMHGMFKMTDWEVLSMTGYGDLEHQEDKRFMEEWLLTREKKTYFFPPFPPFLHTACSDISNFSLYFVLERNFHMYHMCRGELTCVCTYKEQKSTSGFFFSFSPIEHYLFPSFLLFFLFKFFILFN